MSPFRLAALAFLALCAAARAQTEGIAEFKGTVRTDRKQTIPSQGKVFLSKAAVRVEWQTDLRDLARDRKESSKSGAMPDQFRMVMIQRVSEPDRIYIVNEESKTYTVQMIDEKRDAARPERAWKVQKLGRDTVAGFSCQKALLTALDGDETEACLTAELSPSTAWLRAWNRREEQSSPLKALKENGLEGFPVRWIFRTGRDKDIASTVELVRFDRRAVSSASFEIPAGYRKVDSVLETRDPDARAGEGDARGAATHAGSARQDDSRTAKAVRADAPPAARADSPLALAFARRPRPAGVEAPQNDRFRYRYAELKPPEWP